MSIDTNDGCQNKTCGQLASADLEREPPKHRFAERQSRKIHRKRVVLTLRLSYQRPPTPRGSVSR